MSQISQCRIWFNLTLTTNFLLKQLTVFGRPGLTGQRVRYHVAEGHEIETEHMQLRHRMEALHVLEVQLIQRHVTIIYVVSFTSTIYSLELCLL